MNKKFALLTIVALVTFNTTFANPKSDPAPQKIQQEFKKEFAGAADVVWTTKATFYKVSFLAGGQPLEAFYSLTNEFMGLSRNITFNQLPLLLQKGIKETYASYHISNLFEAVTTSGTAYYITFENGNQQVTLQAGTASWSVYNKTVKG